MGDHFLKTKRLVIGQVSICNGCCCGQTERGMPEVPVQWLKDEWRRRGLLKRVQLSISGCLGPCDLPNVVVVTHSGGTTWLGDLTDFGQYRSLVEWACRSKDAGELLPLPDEFKMHVLNPWR